MLAWRAAMRWVRGDVDGCQALLDPSRRRPPQRSGRRRRARPPCTRPGRCSPRSAATGAANAWSYRKALDHAERAGDVIQMVRIRTNMGSHFTEEGSYREALAELDTAIERGRAGRLGDVQRARLLQPRRHVPAHGPPRRRAAATCARPSGIWERLGSDDVDYALGQLGDVQYLRGQQLRGAGRSTPRRSSSPSRAATCRGWSRR